MFCSCYFLLEPYTAATVWPRHFYVQVPPTKRTMNSNCILLSSSFLQGAFHLTILFYCFFHFYSSTIQPNVD
ncbi:MAG: hypothetical protein BYD32DRAFT_405977 [Podila humilis]|nr:MAG: hypothetical protein BYD32DRAFT_405977 [Podila humilis]